MALLLVSLWFIVPAAAHDFRTNLAYGDQTSHLQAALSIAYDSHTLNFDRADAARWHALGWTAQPRDLFFQRYDGGWAAAKPYGYPLYLAPFIAVLGAVRGVGIGNALLLALLVGMSAVLAWRRFDALTAALSVAAFYFAGYVYMYAYPVQVELFEAVVVLVAFGAAYAHRRSGRLGWAALSIAAMAFGVAERAPQVILFAPLAGVLLWEQRRQWRRIVALLAIGVATLTVAALPYLKYSDGGSFGAYGGARYQLSPGDSHPPPWEGGRPNVDYTAHAGDNAAFLAHAWKDPVDKLETLGYYFFGRFTGMLVTLPLGLLVLVAAISRLRRADRWAVAALLGVLGYIAFYVVVFTKNFYGGGQSLGDRYFVQFAPAVFVLMLLAPFSARLVRVLSVAAVALSVLLVLPHHERPDVAFIDILRTSGPQRFLPVEANQDYTWIWRQPMPPPPP